MKNMISKFFNKECKIDLDLLVELKCRGYIAKSFYKYLVIDKVVKEIWISEKDNKFLVELRDADCSIYCKKELADAENKKEEIYREKMKNVTSPEEFEEIYKEYTKTIDIYSIIDKKRTTKIATLDSKKELLKYLKKNF